ncbi:MAG: hypothetical protein AVDCRST_MAG18-1687, partial [uncultured Thermomicrobiales bacterium]
AGAAAAGPGDVRRARGADHRGAHAGRAAAAGGVPPDRRGGAHRL